MIVLYARWDGVYIIFKWQSVNLLYVFSHVYTKQTEKIVFELYFVNVT